MAWNVTTERIRRQESWSIFKEYLLWAQQWSTLIRRSDKMWQEICMDEQRALEQTLYTKRCQRWEWGQVTQDDCRGAIWAWRAALRKAKAHLELSLESVNKNNKTGYRCTVEGRLRGKRWTCWCMRKGTYWQGTWKGLRYQMPSSPSWIELMGGKITFIF